MTLQEAIEKVLKEHNRPLTSKDLASFINAKGYYARTDKEPIQGNQVAALVKDYPSFFQSINGYIILVENESWRNLVTSYWYLVNSLRGIYDVADIQFIISVLLFYKRLVDINHRPGREYPLNFEEGFKHPLNVIIDGGRSLIKQLKSLEQYSFAPPGVFEECARLLEKIDGHKKQEIWSVLAQIRTERLDDSEFGNIFDYFLSLNSINNYKSSINHTPYSLRELMVGILNPQKGLSIYDPVAGTGGLLIDAFFYIKDRQIEIRGSEINRRVAQLGNMNLMMHGISNAYIESKDCFEQIISSRQFEYIIADLPANVITNSLEYFMLFSRYGLKAPPKGKGFGSLVLLVLSKLEDGGKAVLTVSDGFLVKKGGEQDIRNLLIEQDIIESIISLPYGTLRPYTDAKASLLVLNKRKPYYLARKIKFITARVLNEDQKSLTLNNDEIIKAYKSYEVISKDAQTIDISDLRPDSNLSADAYDTEYMLANLMLKEGSGVVLSDLVEIKSGIQPDKVDIIGDGDIALIKIENLSKDILDLNLTKEVSNKIHLNSKYSRSIVNKECILIARIGESLKPTIYRPSKETPEIIPHSNVYVLMPVTSGTAINIEYLYYQLHTSFVQEQVTKRRLGAIMPFISIAGLKQIVIPYMKLEAQISSVESQKANLIAEERMRVEARIRALGYKEEVKQTESDIVRTLVHQLRPTLTNIDLQVKKIRRISDENNTGSLKEKLNIFEDSDDDFELNEHIHETPNFTLGEIIQRLETDSLRLSEVLTTVNKVMSFKLSAVDFEYVNLFKFITDYLALKSIDIDGKFQTQVSGENFNVEINKTAFEDLIEQLLLNAISHGFLESKTPISKRKVQFNIRQNKERGIAIIEYQNNGEPFNLGQDDFVKPFHKSQKSKGSGIGGNYIFRIIQAHGGEMSIKSSLKNGFAITFEIPLKQTKEYE